MGRKSGLYIPLGERLRRSGNIELTFTLPEINKILEESHHQLPESASRHRAWWGNSESNPQAKEGWLDYGYEVVAVQFNSKNEIEKVTFRNQKSKEYATDSKYSLEKKRSSQTLPEEVKKCVSCLKTINKDFDFCPYCGAKQNYKCPNCGTILQKGFNFCPNCGEKRKDT